MCNLYRNRVGAAEVARLFRVDPGDVRPFNAAKEIYPGYPGMVVRPTDAGRDLAALAWGFPVRLKSMRPTSKPKPVNNTRDDKLRSFFWRDSFLHRRCLIPATQWAEAEGAAVRMTRTWYSLPGIEVMTIAGIWRPTDEWGESYSMVMVDASAAMSDVHDRMPVILRPEDQDQWMRGTPDEAEALVRTWPGELVVERTADPWFTPKAKKPGV